MRASGPALAVGTVHVAPQDMTIPDSIQVIHSTAESGQVVATVHLPRAGEYLLEVVRLYDNFSLETPELLRNCISRRITQPTFVGRVHLPNVPNISRSADGVETSPFEYWTAQPPAQVWTRMQMMHLQAGTACSGVFVHSQLPSSGTTALLRNHSLIRTHNVWTLPLDF